MNVSDLAVGIACIAFLITQVHLWRVAKKLIRKSEDSWRQARSTIFESSKVIHDDVVAQIAESGKNSPLGDIKTTFAELDARVNALPGMVEDKILKIQGGLRESFTIFSDGVVKHLEALECIIPKLPPSLQGGTDPRAAQAAGVEARKINQIITTLEGGVVTGGDIVGAANDLGQVLAELGEPNLQEWLVEHPTAIPKVYAIAMRHPRLAKQMQAFQQRFMGGNGPAGPQGSRGGEI